MAEQAAKNVVKSLVTEVKKQETKPEVVTPESTRIVTKSESPLASSVTKSISPGSSAIQVAVEKPQASRDVSSYSVAITDIATGEVSVRSVPATSQSNKVSIPGIEPGKEYAIAVVATTSKGVSDVVSTSKVVIASAASEKPQPITAKKNNAGTGTFQNIELQPKAGQVKGSNVKVTFKGLKPGQKLRVTVIESGK